MEFINTENIESIIAPSVWDISSVQSNNKYYSTREVDVRKKIFKMTQEKHNISFIYKESLRSMIASFNDIVFFDGEDKIKEVKCIHANPERTIAKLNQENNILLPILSISQTTSDNDEKRMRYESLLINEKYFNKEENRAYRVLSLAPRAINIKYEVNIWTKYRSDLDQILEQIRLKFNPDMSLPTKFSTLSKAYLVEEQSSGDYTALDKIDRVIKKSLSIVLKTYIHNPKFLVTSTGKIEEFKGEIDICNN